MDQHNTPLSPPNGNQTVRATTTPFHALVNPVHLLVIVILVGFAIAGIHYLSVLFNLCLTILVIVVLLFLPLFIWGILTREIEIDDDGIRYHEAFRHLSLPWSTLESVNIESHKGQITLRSNGKDTRIHTLGLRAEEVENVHQALIGQLQAHQIKFRI